MGRDLAGGKIPIVWLPIWSPDILKKKRGGKIIETSGKPMGDSVISVAFQGFAAAVGGKVSFSLLADSPLSEVVEKIEAQIQNQPCDIYDCTSSSTPSLVCLLKLDEKGTDAVTLQSLGWFPSANLIVVEKGAEISHSLIDDYWGGQRSKSSDELPPKIIDSKRQKVSEIMAAVENRVIEDTRVSPKKKSVKVLDWMAKVRRLDSIIDDSKGKKGSSSKKKKAVGEKVKQMLIKSKAKGEKRLREEDRFYFEVAVLEETEDDKHNSSIEYVSNASYADKTVYM